MPPTRTERQVEGVTDKRHQHDLAFCQFMTAVEAGEQIIAAIYQIADDHQPNRTEQRNAIVIADDLPDLFPVYLFGVDHQQHNHCDKK